MRKIVALVHAGSNPVSYPKSWAGYWGTGIPCKDFGVSSILTRSTKFQTGNEAPQVAAGENPLERVTDTAEVAKRRRSGA